MPDFLHRMTIHRLMLYYLAALFIAAEIFCAVGILPYRPLDLTYSAAVIGPVSVLTGIIFARSFGAPPNWDSVFITSLILILIITPFAPRDLAGFGYAVFASAWAMAGKYILAAGKRPLFNPAALGVALAAAALGNSVSWWVGGSLYFLPVMLLGGILILGKMRCLDLLLSFAAAALVTVALASGGDPLRAVTQIALHSMFFFFGFVMLTEPRTAPQGRFARITYGVIVGILFAPEIHAGAFYSTPETALLAGNLFSATRYLWRRRGIGALA